ncbi:hypothetical protein BO86DRAFT_211753 [Aspergillus japonicus CBS 114.51]|uniref:Uncharacterized protein n=1 Tax=Aspergillus japonicus CBS 114.51 TaxID=1448312 RepID=A0A8T8XAH4_ASPJA|nr:hypothetical protein BO86DRAFT_211753 [Aspergillus japonicus CBS 114.51]RAH85045.1 hypothetical protein BO86DRAFT_211753 [Aspergillus japonicus CBS 114.51]
MLLAPKYIRSGSFGGLRSARLTLLLSLDNRLSAKSNILDLDFTMQLLRGAVMGEPTGDSSRSWPSWGRLHRASLRPITATFARNHTQALGPVHRPLNSRVSLMWDAEQLSGLRDATQRSCTFLGVRIVPRPDRAKRPIHLAEREGPFPQQS